MTHAISSNKPTAPIRMIIARRVEPTTIATPVVSAKTGSVFFEAKVICFDPAERAAATYSLPPSMSLIRRWPSLGSTSPT